MNHPLGPSGFIVIDKPAGITSFDVIRELRPLLHIRKLGHSGVLDKPATGVLVVGANRATRLFDLFSTYEKEYSAEVWYGLSTTTDDMTGELVEAPGAAAPTRETLETALATYRGSFLQIPPAFSLTKKGGRELYRYALAGEAVEVEPKPVAVLDSRIADFTPGIAPEQAVAAESKLAPELGRLGPLTRAQLELRCTGGFYVRSLARDTGADMGTRGALGKLVRTRVGPFRLAQAWKLEALAQALSEGQTVADVLLPLSCIAPEELRLDIDDKQLSLLRHGQPIRRFRQYMPPGAQERGDLVYALAPSGTLAAVLQVHASDERGLVELRIARQLL